jgi:toxin ParE1/3/4
VILSDRAVFDLLEIERYSTEQWGRKTAEAYLSEFESALERLSHSPGLLQLEPGLSTGLYFYRVQKHVLVCDLREQLVAILTVLHTSMDLPSRLMELEPRVIAEVELLRRRLDAGKK